MVMVISGEVRVVVHLKNHELRAYRYVHRFAVSTCIFPGDLIAVIAQLATLHSQVMSGNSNAVTVTYGGLFDQGQC